MLLRVNYIYHTIRMPGLFSINDVSGSESLRLENNILCLNLVAGFFNPASQKPPTLRYRPAKHQSDGRSRCRCYKFSSSHSFLQKADVRHQRLLFGCRNRIQTGLPTEILLPVGSRAPVFWSIRKTTTLLPPWLATRQNLPVGSILKFRGVFISALSCSTKVSVPLAGSMR